MARGVPCVVTDVGDAGWIVGETGHIVPPGDSAALAGAMLGLAALGADGRAALGARARTRIMADFDLDAVVRRYGDLVRDVAARGPAGRAARTALAVKAVS
jgi:glycosyltransferase involved in cell wall biosynthesis